jgi:hypothetical protein
MLLDFSNISSRILIAVTSTKLIVNLHVKRDEISEGKNSRENWGYIVLFVSVYKIDGFTCNYKIFLRSCRLCDDTLQSERGYQT